MRLSLLLAVFASLPLSAQPPDCQVLLVSYAEARVVNLPPLHTDLLSGPTLKIGDVHYAIPNVSHLIDRGIGGPARLAWKQALTAARAAGPEAEALCRRKMSEMLLMHFTTAEGFTETYEIQTPGGRTTKFVLPDGTVVHLGGSANLEAMRRIQAALR